MTDGDGPPATAPSRGTIRRHIHLHPGGPRRPSSTARAARAIRLRAAGQGAGGTPPRAAAATAWRSRAEPRWWCC